MGLFYGWSGLVLLVMLVPLPGDKLIWLSSLDSLVHFGLFVILGGLGRRILEETSDRNRILLVTISLLLFVPESLQMIVPGRSFEWLDLFFNAGGIVSGVALVSAFDPLLYLELGSLSLGGAFLANLFSSRVYELVFVTNLDVVLLPVIALNLLVSVLLLARLSHSATKRFLVVFGGIVYLFVLRAAGGVLPQVISGVLLLVVFVGLYFKDHQGFPRRFIKPVTDLLLILYLASAVSVTFSQPFFLLHAGTILGVGTMLGILFLYTVRTVTYRRTFAETSSGQS